MLKHIYDWHKYVSTSITSNNNTICPFSKNAKFIIFKGNINFIEEKILKWNDEFDVIIIEYDKYISVNKAICIENRLNKLNNNIAVLLEHFEDPGYIEDVYTGCGHNKILFLLQNRYELNNARKILEKKNYYSNWTKEYKEKIWRNK